MKLSTQEVLEQVAQARSKQAREQVVARELVLADSNSREVYKDKNIERAKYVSRDEREELESLTSSPLGPSSRESPEGLEGLLAQEEEVSVIAPARTTPRITGISMQHVKTEKGIKINVAIQDEQDALQGLYSEVTAELKRHGRLRELRRYKHDDCEFEQLYIGLIEELKELTPAQGKRIALGRLHERGIRGKWIANMFVFANLDESGTLVTNALININGQEYEVELNGVLSPSQQKLYHSTGIYGNLASTRPAPTLATLKRKQFNP
jgi:hypothetical protein